MTDTIQFITPAPLQTGDLIAIVSPSGRVKKEFVENAAQVLTDLGWDTTISQHALGEYGTFSGSPEERFADLREALLDPGVKAILCSRGGYGAVHILDELNKLPLRDNAKWLIGFSDISALHGLMSTHGIHSLHASMAKHLSKYGGEDSDSQALFSILRGEVPEIEFPASEFNRCGTAQGPMFGGNLAVIAGLIDTTYDIIRPDSILFIEDIAEPVYKVERQLYQLHLSGRLAKLRGLVVGQFTDYGKDVNHESMEEMIARITARYTFPVAFNAPIGHVDHNIPIIEGAETILSVTPAGVTIHQSL